MIRYTVRVPIRLARDNSMTFAGLLDMMRYDAAKIVTWSHETKAEIWVLHLEGERLTTSRWESFGLHPVKGWDNGTI